jgi:hypothetical protein
LAGFTARGRAWWPPRSAAADAGIRPPCQNALHGIAGRSNHWSRGSIAHAFGCRRPHGAAGFDRIRGQMVYELRRSAHRVRRPADVTSRNGLAPGIIEPALARCHCEAGEPTKQARSASAWSGIASHRSQ